jgi:hypothetical protein
MATAKQQLDSFLAKYTPALASDARRALAKMRKLTPGALELVYDNYNGLVVGFSPNEKPSVAILSLLMLPDHVTLCFLQGKGLPDPQKLLQGSGNVVRHLRLESLRPWTNQQSSSHSSSQDSRQSPARPQTKTPTHHSVHFKKAASTSPCTLNAIRAS